MKALLVSWILISTSYSEASQYDVDIDWPTSKGNVHSLRVAINGCDTVFLIKTNELEKLSNDNKSLDKVLKQAIEHYKTGCK